MKNITPFQLTVFSSLAVSIFSILIFILISYWQGSIDWNSMAIIFFIILFISWIVFRISVELFFYRKIKLIYKTISTFKTGNNPQSKKIDIKENILKQTEDDVNEWAKSHLAEIDEMKRTELYRREFLSNISHELKTPIFNIQGYLHTLIDGGLKDKKINKKYLDKAAKNLEHLTNIVNDLEVISRLESGEQPINMQKFDIHNLTHDIIDELELLADKKDITISFKEGCNNPMLVMADKEKIKQVLINLVTNSIRYSNEGGKTQIGIYDMADNVLVEVSDTGIGIAQEHIPRLFERFYRIDKSRSKDEGGSGLGLAIVKHIIEAHNQNVNVRSTVGVGSTFGFTLKKA